MYFSSLWCADVVRSNKDGSTSEVGFKYKKGLQNGNQK